jgi:hypothetical protein
MTLERIEMIFNGDLSKYHPADAIMFLSQLNLNGVLSITENQRLITLSFDNGFIVDAYSGQGDAKILQGLIFSRRVTGDQVKHIRRIQAETGLPIRPILAQLNLFPLSTVKDILLTGMKEVLLEMFLLDEGAFHFTDTPVEGDDVETKLDARILALSIAAQSDEHRDFVKGVISLDRAISVSTEGTQAPSLPTESQVVLRLATSCATLRQVLDKAPFDSGTVVAIIKAQMDKGVITLGPSDPAERPAPSASSGDPLFGSFRQALKKLMLSDDPMKRIEALVTFCKGFYDGILILTAKAGQVVHCKQMHRVKGKGRNLDQRSAAGPLGGLDEDPVLLAVHRSGVGFFGNRFPSRMLDKLSGTTESGECALIPVVNKGQVAVFIYVFSENTLHRPVPPTLPGTAFLDGDPQKSWCCRPGGAIHAGGPTGCRAACFTVRPVQSSPAGLQDSRIAAIAHPGDACAGNALRSRRGHQRRRERDRQGPVPGYQTDKNQQFSPLRGASACRVPAPGNGTAGRQNNPEPCPVSIHADILL